MALYHTRVQVFDLRQPCTRESLCALLRRDTVYPICLDGRMIGYVNYKNDELGAWINMEKGRGEHLDVSCLAPAISHMDELCCVNVVDLDRTDALAHQAGMAFARAEISNGRLYRSPECMMRKLSVAHE